MAELGPDERILSHNNPNINSAFNLQHHGDEVIVGSNEKDQIQLLVKVQTGHDTFRSTLLTFNTQTQVERLFPAIMKGLAYDNKR